MTMHRIILDTLWTIASEVLCLPRNTASLSTISLAYTKVFVAIDVVVLGCGILGLCLEKYSQKN